MSLNPSEKIDVCVVSRDGKLPKGLENIPMSNLIVETSKPIGVARQRAIAQVTSPAFAFIDDDIIISETWFPTVAPYLAQASVGAVMGTIHDTGFGFLDRYLSSPLHFKTLKMGDRLLTHNTLIKTEAVRDWVPTYGMNCYEDLDLGNHIMSKGLKIMLIPTDTKHHKGLYGIALSAYWAGSTFTEAYKITFTRLVWEYVRRIFAPIKTLFFNGIFYTLIACYRNFFFLSGLTISLFKKLLWPKSSKNETQVQSLKN